MKPFECPVCGGTVELRPSEPRTQAYRNIENLRVPSVELPICSECGEEWLDKEASARLHAAVEEAYTEALHARSEWALQRVQEVLPQREMERLLGLSAGYLSKVKAGKKTSGQLTVALLLLANDTAKRIAELEKLLLFESVENEGRAYGRKGVLSMDLPEPSVQLSLAKIPSVQATVELGEVEGFFDDAFGVKAA